MVLGSYQCLTLWYYRKYSDLQCIYFKIHFKMSNNDYVECISIALTYQYHDMHFCVQWI